MKIILKKTILAVVCSATLMMAGCNDDKNQFVSGNTFISEVNYNQDTLAEAASIKTITYSMNNVLNNKSNATALVMFPKTAKPSTGWRVVVWAHGTTGVGDSCAPSRNPIGANFKILANSLLAAGYVIVAPDYEGLGTRGIHPYLNLGSAAKSAISAIDAVQEKYGRDLNKSWMSVGQSQGGHASLGIAEYSNTNPSYKGAVATAPASSLGFIITQIAPSAITQLESAGQINRAKSVYAELLSYAAYTGVGIRAYDPQFNLATIFESDSKLIAEKAEGTTGENGLCLIPLIGEFTKDIETFLSNNPTKKIMEYPGLKKDFEKDPVVAKFLIDNQPATKKLDKPLYVVQGGQDTAVPYQVTENLVQQLNALGTTPPAIFELVPNASHTEAIVQRNAEVVAFIQNNMPAQ